MPSLGNLWYQILLKDSTDAELDKIKQKLQNLGVTVDVKNLRASIEAGIGATPFNASVNWGGAQASLESVLLNKKYGVSAEVIASKLYDSINAALAKYTGNTLIVPKKKELRKAVNDALLSAGFEINVGKVKGLSTAINNVLGSDHNIKISVDPKKLSDAIEKAIKSYKGDAQIPLEAKEKILHDSIRKALKSEKFPIKVIVDKAEAQDAVRQALQAAGLQSGTGFTASDKRAWDAQSRRMEAEARAAAASALAQRRLAGAHNAARAATDSHIHSSISLGSAMRGNIRIAGELGPMLASAYSVVALKNFMQKVIDIGGELEKQKLAMKAILGDEGMANTISSQINTLAVKSPFGIMELNQYAKQLTAFQIPYNELYDTMKRMADVSAAVGVDMGRIILAYGQVRAAKFLKGTELRQFTEANIPLIDMLAQRFTKLKGEIISAGDVMDMISNKEVSFEDVKAVLWGLTGEGGRFYNMQEVLSESVQAKWKNLADAIDLMFADIAESTAGPLKGLAELLTALTSRWKTIAVIIASAAGTFGVAKVATLAWNAALSKTTLSAIKDAKSAKQIEAANLRVASTYRTLTAAEQGLIHTKGRLTAAQYVQLAAEGKLTKEQVLRLIALKKLDANTIGHLRSVLGITKAEVSAAQATKAWRVRIAQLGATMRSVGRSIAGFFLNPLTIAMAAVGTMTALWQKNSEEMQKAEQLGEDLMTKSSEGARNLKQVLDSMPGVSRGMSNTELTSGVEKLRQVVKDYSTTAEKDLLAALVNQKGEVASLAEQYDILREKVQLLHDAMSENVTSRMSKILADSVGDAGDGWFDDNLLSDIEDFAEQYNGAQKILAKNLKLNNSMLGEAVKLAREASPEFDAVASMLKSDEQILSELIRNAERYEDVFDKLGKNNDFKWVASLRVRYNTALAPDISEFENEFRQTLQNQLSRLAVEGITPDNATAEQRLNLIAWFERITESLPEEGKRIAREIFEGMWKIDLDDGMAERAVVDAFGRAFEAAHPELAKRLKAGLAINDMELVDYTSATTMVLSAADEVVAKMPQFRDKVQGFLNDNQFLARVLVEWQALGQDSELKKMLWSGDEKNLRIDAFAAEKIFDRMAAGAKSTRDVRENYIKEGKDIKERIKATKANNAAAAELEKLNTEWNLHAESFRRAHFGDFEAAVNEKKGGSTSKDPLAESLRQRFKDIKDAWNEFQKWSKSEGKTAAAKRIGESGLFSTLSADRIPQTVEQYRALVEELEKELRDAGIKGHSQRESLLNELLKQLLVIDKSVVDEQLRKTKEQLDASIKDFTRRWDFRKKLFELTGDRETSAKLAFGENVAWQTQGQMLESILNTQLAERGLDVPLTISDEDAKKKLENTPLYDMLWKPTKEAKQKEELELSINVAKAVADAAPIADKIKVQEGLRDHAVDEYRNSEAFARYGEAGAEAVAKPFNDKILELRSTMLQLLPVWEQIFGDREYASMRQLDRGINAAQGIIDNATIHYNNDGKADYFTSVVTNDDGSTQEIQGNIALLEKLRKAVVSLNKEADKLNPFRRLANVLKEVFSLPEEGESADDTETKLRKLGASLAEVADMTGNLAGQLSEMFEAVGNDSMAQAMSDVQDVMSSVSNIGKGFAEGGVAGGIAAAAGEAIGWVTKAFQASARHKEALRAIMNETLAQQREYNLLLMQQNLEYKKAATILGEDAYAKARNAVKVMKSAYAELNKEVEGTEKQQKQQREHDNYARAVYSLFGAKFDEAKAAAREAYAGLADLEIKTGHKKTGLFGWGKGKDIYSSILDVYPELIDANGKFNVSLAETIINTRKMKDEDKETFQNMIDLAKQAEAAYEELNSYMTDIFGELGSTMTDILVSAFANGTDAAEDFYDSVSDMLEALAKQMIYSVTLAPMIEQAQKQMMDIMNNDALTDEQRFSQWSSVLGGMLEEAVKQQGVADGLLKKYQDLAAEKGFDIFKPDEDQKNGLSASIQSNLREEDFGLLASYVNGIRSDVSVQTHDLWPRLLDVSLPHISVIAQSQLDTQRQIAENTLRNANAAEAIVKSNDDISRLLARVTQGGAKFHVQ